MSTTVLDIGQKLSDDCGLPSYGNLVGNQQQNARKILRSISDGLLLDAFIDQDWEMLKKAGSVTTSGGGVTTYALPDDFERIVNSTIWDDTNYEPIRGPVDLVEWQELVKGSVQLSGLELVCRIQGALATNTKVITFYPDTSASTVSFWYVSNKPVISSDGTLKTEISADTDQFVIPDEVVYAAAKWRLLRSIGMNFQDERIEYASILDDFSANDGGGKRISMVPRRHRLTVNTPDRGFGS